MDASRFPITTPYGQVPGYPLNNGWHRGEDRAMPMDTPVLVNGHEIGLSGNTGEVTGPHLHIGRFVGGHDTPPSGGGFHFGQAVVTEVSEDAVNGKFVRVQADGASWVYLHLSRQSVPVGQELVPSGSVSPAPPPTPASYQVVETYPGGKQIQLNKDTNLWGMNYHFDFMVAHPVETGHKQGEIWTVTNKVHHEDNYDYYRRDGQVDGFNVLDCNDYTPPPPYVPPAAPLPIPKVEYYELVATVLTFKDSEDAAYHQNVQGTIDAGQYIVLESTNTAKHLIRKNTDKDSYWINVSDNVLPVVPPTPEPTPEPEVVPAAKPVKPPVAYYWLNESHRLPYRYRSTNSTETVIKDLDGIHKPIPFPAHYEGNFSMYADVGSIRYLLPDKTRLSGWNYAVAETMLQPVKPSLDLNHNGVADTAEVTASWDKFIEIIPQWVSSSKMLLPKVTQATTRLSKSIEGVSAKRKVK